MKPYATIRPENVRGSAMTNESKVRRFSARRDKYNATATPTLAAIAQRGGEDRQARQREAEREQHRARQRERGVSPGVQRHYLLPVAAAHSRSMSDFFAAADLTSSG